MRDGEKPRARRKKPTHEQVVVPVLMTVVTCPSCGAGVEMWTGDEETSCFACDHRIFRKQRNDH